METVLCVQSKGIVSISVPLERFATMMTHCSTEQSSADSLAKQNR